MVPLYLAVLGAVLQFDSGDQPGGDFPSLLHSDDFELHLLVEYVGALVSGTFLVSLTTEFHTPPHKSPLPPSVASSGVVATTEVWW